MQIRDAPPEIDLNCDMGESFGAWTLGSDEILMPYLSSANVACGAHAGDPSVMERTVLLAKRHNVAVGAHPGYPDLAGFGRRAIAMDMNDLRTSILGQIGALYAIARSAGVELHHVKPHGALYNSACTSFDVARAIARAVAAFSNSLRVYCLPGSQLEHAVLEHGLLSVPEGFADRRYEPNGLLVDRKGADAVLADPDEAGEQAVQLANGRVLTRNGTLIDVQVRTICIHGDNPQAAAILPAVREALESNGWRIGSGANS